jgi:ATPase subunit of ABC transporter with duplicated ATPase domains
MESRIALVGRNGAGKTTLLQLLAKHLTPTRGHVEHASRLRIGWFAQHFSDSLLTEQSAVMYLHEKYPEHEYETLRKYLGMFGLPGKRHLQAIKTLSGGEKNRVVFASIALYGAHLLFLDEPTNHLDMERYSVVQVVVQVVVQKCVLMRFDTNARV